MQCRHTVGQRIQIHNHNVNVSGENLNLELGSLQRDVALGHCKFDGTLVLEADVGKVVGTNLQKHDLATVLEVVK